MAKVNGKLPVQWTKETVVDGRQELPGEGELPGDDLPESAQSRKYVVLNTGLTIPDAEYNGDYGMPRWGDYAVVKVKDGADVPDLVTAGLFDENWRLTATAR